MTFDLITFDVYSALFDITTSLLGPVLSLCGGDEARARQVIGEWRRLQLQYTLIVTLLGRGHVPFRVVTRRALDVALHRLGVEADEATRVRLVAAWDDLTPWPEAPVVLREVKARGYPIAVLSNGDEVMLRAVTRRLGVTFEHVFAADQAGVYKPHPDIYHLPVRRVGVTPERVLHVAGSGRDVMGAKSAGLACFWVNRNGDRLLDPALGPDMSAPDLTGLLDVIESRG